MLEKECASLCSQLAFTYGANRRSPIRFRRLIFAGLGGQTRERLAINGDSAYLRWQNVEWLDSGYNTLYKLEQSGGMPEAPYKDNGMNKADMFHQSQLVYLTADADEELDELKEGEAYILGGIVDHNRYKNLCLMKAREEKLRTARLPIGRYMAELQTRKVLTVNQVFEILLSWIEVKDWGKAFQNVVPQRKLRTGPALSV